MLDGYCFVVDARGDENALLSGEEARDLYREMGTNVSISFPVNDPTSQFILATARRPDGTFAVDALSTDGGGIPRNVTVDHGLAIVALGGLSLSTFVQKACAGAGPDDRAGSEGAPRRGRRRRLRPRGPGDPDGQGDHRRRRARSRSTASWSAAAARVVTTARGERAVRQSGLPYEVVDLARSGLYAPERMTGA